MKTILLLIIFCVPLFTNSQVASYLSTDTIDVVVNNGISNKGYHYYILVKSIEALNYQKYNSYLYKFDNNLTVVDSVYFAPINSWKLYPLKTLVYEDTLIVMGTAIDTISSSSQVFLSRLSENFNYINHKLIETSFHHTTFTDAIISMSNKIIVAGMEGVDFMNTNPLILQCDNLGNLEICSIDTTIKLLKPMIVELPEKKIYHIAGYSKIAIYDSTLNLLNAFKPDYYNWFQFSFHLANYEGNNYFIGGNKSVLPEKEKATIEIREDIDKDISYYLLNENAFPIDSGIIRNKIIRDYTGGIYYSNNSFTLGGILNYVVGEFPYFAEETNWIAVQNIDFNTKSENWYFEYGGDANYYMNGLYVDEETKETFVYCDRYDWLNTSKHERDVFIIKLDSTGLLVGVTEKPPEVKNKLTLFPNPGKDQLFMKGINGQSEIVLYDLYGQNVLNAVVESEQNPVSTGMLKNGIYFYKIQSKNAENSFSGVWIKQ